MNLDIGLARFTLRHFKYIDTRIELGPLTRPVVSYIAFPDDTAARRLGPTDILTHQHECGVNVSLIERSVSLRDQLLYGHAFSYHTEGRFSFDDVPP